MPERTTAHVNVHRADYEPFLHEATGKEIAQLTLCHDGRATVIAGRAPAGGIRYRREARPGESQAFFVVSGHVHWRPDEGEPVEWGAGDLVLVPGEAAGEVEYSHDHVCVLFAWHEERPA